MTMNKNEKKFWNIISSKDEQKAEIVLYGEISSVKYSDNDIEANEFVTALKKIGNVQEIVVRINSCGGDVFVANTIYSLLKESNARIIVKIDGWCASAATIIAMAGDKIEISDSGVFMIHDPMLPLYGYYNQEEIARYEKSLEVVKQAIVNCYMSVTKKTEEEIKEMMKNETWLTGQEAVEHGFCTNTFNGEIETVLEDDETIRVNKVSMNVRGFKMFHNKLLEHIQSTNHKNRKENVIMTLEELKEKHPDLVEKIKEEAKKESQKEVIDAERKRLQAIDELAMKGFETLANKAKYEDCISAEQFAIEMIKCQKEQGSVYLNQVQEDLMDSGMQNVHMQKMNNPKENEIDHILDKIL